jgi:hypothetical protein
MTVAHEAAAPATRRRRDAMAAARYEFRVRGRMSDDTAGEFDELEVLQATPETVLHGEVTDDAHLHGILARFQALGLHVVSMREVRP